MRYPRAFSHIGISVSDLEKAVEFYRDVMGWYVIMGPTLVVEEKEMAIGQMCIDVFGEGWDKFKIAHLSTIDGIGVELFEFGQNTGGKAEFEPYKTGVFHFSVKDPEVEGLAEKILEAGGKQRMPIKEYYPGEKPYRTVYMEDTFGNIIEIYCHSYELHYGAGAYQHQK